jgi:hypothetical protein
MIALLPRTVGLLALTALVFGCAQRATISSGSAHALTGVVYGESGRLVSHAIVELAPVDQTDRILTDTTDERGRYHLDGLAPGMHRMRVVRTGLRQLIWNRVVDASSSDSVRLTMLNSDRGLLVCSPRPPVGLQLVLRDAQTGRFVADRVLAVAQAENYADTLRLASLPSDLGVPVHQGIPARAGAYQVSIQHPDYEEVRFPVLLAPSSCGVTPVLLEVFLAPQR